MILSYIIIITLYRLWGSKLKRIIVFDAQYFSSFPFAMGNGYLVTPFVRCTSVVFYKF